ncbi:DUF6056 family protein [Butyrivibrio fibrisolvens]|uniref:DUF6056 family protein n=1 Tax=Butyrivibrio fibrisolvens TaxID=831 RepID=UPI0004109FB8|nr:DUF6056 family protein [Butyrivibrio fibrisolvens]
MNRIGDLKNILNYIIVGICLLLTIYMIGVLVWSSSFSVFEGDDFGVISFVSSTNSSAWTCFKAGFVSVAHFYTEWQGTYLSAFLVTAINPIAQHGLGQLRLVMAINSLLFFCTLIFFILNALKKMNLKFSAVTAIIITSIVFSICGYETYPEIFFWFTGATGYSFPLSFLLISLGVYIRLSDSDKKIRISTIVAAVCGVLGMGGALVISGMGCFVALLVLLYELIDKRISKNKLVVFISMLIGALINALAPGNFVRQANTDGAKLSIFGAIVKAFVFTIDRWQVLLGYNFLLLLIIVFLCGLVVRNKDSKINFIKVGFSLLGLLTPIVSAFPYALGTGGEGIADRCAFVFDLGIILSSFFCCFLFGNIVAMVTEYRFNKYIIVVVLIISVIYCKYDGYGVYDCKTYELTKMNISGDLYNHYRAHVNFYEWLRTQEGEDVAITPEHCPYGIDNVHNLFISTDPDNWVNRAISRYYGVKSIVAAWY